jgi:hypothetical protein
MNKQKPQFKKNEYVYFQFITYQIENLQYDEETQSYWYRLKRSGQFFRIWVEENKLETTRITE